MSTTPAKERPILFSGPMVRAIIEGRKTQTRRVVKLDHEILRRGCVSLEGAWVDQWLGAGAYMKVPGPYETSHRLYCPYGYKLDRLWVKETFMMAKPAGADLAKEVPFYRASTLNAECCKWKPSIFMPRMASRVTLEISTVRVERLQAITPEDVLSEGLPTHCVLPTWKKSRRSDWKRDLPALFRDLWDKLNARRGYGWASNPWVWVIEFRRVLDG